MTGIKHHYYWASPAIIAVVAIGCGKYAPVEGVVTLDGQPISQATLTFVPVEKSSGGVREATARADTDGRFRVKTSTHEGMIPGKYKVLVYKRVFPKGLENPQNLGEAIQATRQSKESLPKQYTDEKSTPLEIDVPSGGVRDLEIALKSK